MKTVLLSLIVFLSFFSFSQPWLNTSSKNSISEKGNFYDSQEHFNQYWENKNVENGYYFIDGVRSKAAGWKQFKRWENFHSTRINKETGGFPSKKQITTANSQYYSNQNRSLSGAWSSVGPISSTGGYAGVGRINQIAFHPTDNNTFWVTTPNGGLWTTSNGGASWVALTDHLDVLTSTSVGIPSDFESSNTIYLGTGEMMSNEGGIGVLKSTNGGSTWNATGLTFNVADKYSVNRIIIHPTNTNIVYAATDIGVYKTSNGGTDWTLLSSDWYINDLEFKPNDPSIFYASSRYYGKVYKFTNNGTSVSTTYYNSLANRVDIAVTADNPDVVYAISSNNDGGMLELVKSTDNGGTFSQVYAPSNPPTISQPDPFTYDADGIGTYGIAWYAMAFAVSPSEENTLYCGVANVWKSTDGGASWNIRAHWWGDAGLPAVHADEHFFAFNGTTAYLCNDGGLYKSADGSSWDNISNGIVNSQMYKLGVSQSAPNAVITGLQDNGSKLFNSSNTWVDVRGGDGMECIIDYDNYNIQYATYQNGQIGRTTNAWSSTVEITPSGAGDGAWVAPFVLDPNNSNIIYGGYQNVWKSTNNGDNWTQISTMSSDYLQSLSVAKSNSQYIFAATFDYIWKTVDGGTNWTNITSGLPTSSSDITSVTVKNDDENTIWVTLGSYNSDVVYQTTNGGSNWINISAGIPDIPANSVIQNIQNTTEIELYVGTDFGVYVKRGTDNWQLFNTGMPKVVVKELEIYYDINSDNSQMYAATHGRGLWVGDLLDASAVVVNPPSVTTNTASSISETIADLNGTITNNNGAEVTESGFVYSTNTNPLIGGAGVTQIQTSPTVTIGSFTKGISSLIDNTSYFYKAYAINSEGISYGSELSFTTIEIPTGIVMHTGNVTTCSDIFYDPGYTSDYLPDEDYTLTIYPETTGNMIEIEFTSFDIEIFTDCGYDYLEIYDGTSTSASLIDKYCGTTSPGTITATNTDGALTFVFHSDPGVEETGWEANVTCVTGVTISPPSVTTNTATNISITTADLNGTITSDNGVAVTESGFVYSTSANPLIAGAGVIQIQTSPTVALGSFSENISGLIPSTYYYRAYAINNEGTAYGSELSFIIDSENSSQFISQTVPSLVSQNEVFDVTLTFKNTGNTSWQTTTSYSLGSQAVQDNTTWGFNRIALPNDVAPNEQVDITASVTAPASFGDYDFQWKMVQDGAAWFGELSDIVSINVSTNTSVNLIDGTEVSVYPNPSNGIFNVKMNQMNQDIKNVDVTIFNSIGETILTETLSKTVNLIDISETSSGIYLMKISFNKEVKTVSIIKE